MRTYFAALALIGSLLLGGCGLFRADPPPDRIALLTPDKNDAKIFIYVAYDTPDDRPTFPETFRLQITGYENDITADEFLERTIEPGTYNLHIDEIDWGGFVDAGAGISQKMQPGGLYFFKATVFPDKITYELMDNAQGARDVMNRKQKCNCSSSWFR